MCPRCAPADWATPLTQDVQSRVIPAQSVSSVRALCSPTCGLFIARILVVYSQLCGEAEFEACQVAGPPPVQRGAGPVGVQPEEVERAGHVHVVEAGFRQAAVAGAASAVAGGLVHGALDAGAAGVVRLERIVFSAARAAAWASARSRGGSGELAPFPAVVHRLRAGQGPQSAAEKVATIASLPRWVHGVQDADVLPCGQVTVWLS